MIPSRAEDFFYFFWVGCCLRVYMAAAVCLECGAWSPLDSDPCPAPWRASGPRLKNAPLRCWLSVFKSAHTLGWMLCLHTHKSSYTYTHIRPFMHSCMHACMHAYIYTYMHTCIHACMHAFIQNTQAACVDRILIPPSTHEHQMERYKTPKTRTHLLAQKMQDFIHSAENIHNSVGVL